MKIYIKSLLNELLFKTEIIAVRLSALISFQSETNFVDCFRQWWLTDNFFRYEEEGWFISMNNIFIFKNAYCGWKTGGPAGWKNDCFLFLLHFCLWIKNKPHNNCQDRNRGVTGEEGIGIAIDRYGEAVHRLRVLRRSLPFLLILWFVSGPVVVAFISLILHSTNTIIHTVFL